MRSYLGKLAWIFERKYLTINGVLMFSRVVISGDILRVFHMGDKVESATWKNIRWLREILSPALRQNDFQVSTLSWDENLYLLGDIYFDTPALYETLSLPLNINSWAELSVQKHAPDALIDMLRDYVHDALIVGYEMPDVLLDAFRQLNRPFVDIILHPYRFLPDLVFSFRSNISDFYKTFERYHLSQNEVEVRASEILAKSAWMKKPFDIPPGSIILLDQVQGDRALIKEDGNFASFNECLERLHQLCFEHPKVFFKPHPYNLTSDSKYNLIKVLPVIVETNVNFYHLLSQPEIEGAIALNSSGLYESKVFGKRGDNLIPYLYDYNSKELPVDCKVGYPVPLNSLWTTSNFWSQLINENNNSFNGEISNVWFPNRLRRTMNADWGYGFINQLVV
ncbi:MULTISPECIES: hypothetical protein [Pectobacterium]|uniref:hypothetical protein n=1 Tax=Pectobacterium TaxID=122277 RepID=UPI00103CAE1F|nr:hypothetical protein [Pectobacterium brasiliense]